MSMANTRLRRCAHDIARCRSLTDTSPRAAEAAVRVPGTIRARSRLAGANTPWYLVKWARGFGTSATRPVLLQTLDWFVNAPKLCAVSP